VNTFWQIVLVFELLTLGEMLQSPQVPAWVAQITPKEVAGQAQGFVSMMISSGRVVGPIYSGVMMDHGWTNMLFLSVFIVMIIITGLLALTLSRRVDKNSVT
jgi:MFS family permease